MRYLLAMAVVAAAFLAQGGQAYAAVAPWCSYVSTGMYNMTESCAFATFEACRDTVLAGNRGFCNHNPRYVGPVEPTKRRVKR